MNSNPIFLWVVTTLLLGGLQPTYSQEEFPSEKDLRGSPSENDERYEGIRRYEDTSGGLEMKSAGIAYHEDHPENGEYFSLSFYVDDAIQLKDLDILIEDKEGKSYYMKPVRKQWESGIQKFQWNSSFARGHGLDLYDLYALAHVGGYGLLTSILPITLYYDTGPTQIDTYEFVFVSLRQVTIKYSIFNEQDEMIASGSLRRQPKNTEIKIIWDCEDAQEGYYQLFLDNTFTDGSVDEYSNRYEFYHIKMLN